MSQPTPIPSDTPPRRRFTALWAALALFSSLVIFYAFRLPFAPEPTALLVGGLLGLLGLLATLISLLRSRFRPNASPRTGLCCTLALLLSLALILLAFTTDLPLQAGFRLSRSRLDALVRQVLADPAHPPLPCAAGVYDLADIQVHGTTITFRIANNPIPIKDKGFTYAPDPNPPANSDGRYHQHLSGPWYTWTE